MASSDSSDEQRPAAPNIRGVPSDTRAVLVFPAKAMPPADWRQLWVNAGWTVSTCNGTEQLSKALARTPTPALFVSLWQNANDATPLAALAQGLVDAAVACGMPEETTVGMADGANGMLRRGDFLAHLAEVTASPGKGTVVLLAIRVDGVSGLSAQLDATAVFAIEEQLVARLATLVDPGDAYTIWLEMGLGLLVRRENAQQARQLGERICASVAAQPFTLAGEPKRLTVSVGAALTPFGNAVDRADRWFATAHAAQAIAFRRGGNRVEGVLTREFDPIPAERVLIIREWVEEAKAGGNVMVEFQPTPPLRDDIAPMYSVHAKLRDYRAPLGGVYRREYLRLAREAGAMEMIDRMSLFGAFEALEQERTRGLATRLLVPVEAESLEGKPLKWLEAELRRRSHLAAGLVLELEAGPRVEQADFVSRIVKLRETGVRIGLSEPSLKLERMSHWVRMPIDLLRVQLAAVNAMTPEVFGASVAGWENLGRLLLVDGVEMTIDVARFREMGVDYLRGHALATIGPRLDFDFGKPH